MQIFTEISLIIFVATIISFLMRLIKQPLIVGYILAGILVGPFGMNILHATGTIEIFSKFGITILLFIVGLGLNPRIIKDVGRVSVLGGISQVTITSLIGFGIATMLGLDRIAALYVAIGLTFSSTIIILKLLSDKGDVTKLYGKIAVGFLIVQDIIATIILIAVSAFSQSQGNLTFVMSITLLKGIMLLTSLMVFSQLLLPTIVQFAARSQELLFLFSIAWGLSLAAIFNSLGFSIEIGALVAGVSLASTPYAYEIASRTKPLRDFFVVLFFILLGSQMDLSNLAHMLVPGAILSLFVLIGNPIIVIILMNLLGFNKKTGFMTGLTVAQISEFSLILATLGFRVGHVSRDVLSLITFVGLVTISGSTYFIMYADTIYEKLRSTLNFLQLRQRDASKIAGNEDFDIVLFGFDRVGDYFVKAFDKIKEKFIVVDFNPFQIEKLIEQKLPHKYGDAEDPDFLHELNFKEIKMVISTIPYFSTNLFLLKKIRHVNKHAIVILVSHNNEEAVKLYAQGASYVIMPHHLGAQYASKMIRKHGLEEEKYLDEMKVHLEHIQKKEKSAEILKLLSSLAE